MKRNVILHLRGWFSYLRFLPYYNPVFKLLLHWLSYKPYEFFNNKCIGSSGASDYPFFNVLPHSGQIYSFSRLLSGNFFFCLTVSMAARGGGHSQHPRDGNQMLCAFPSEIRQFQSEMCRFQMKCVVFKWNTWIPSWNVRISMKSIFEL